MIWKHLSKAQLQNFIGTTNLRRLENILPGLLKDEYDELDLYKKQNLVKIFNAFVTTQFFKDKRSLKLLLNSLPPDRLDSICDSTSVTITSKSFDEKIDSLLKKGWTDINFCELFLESANLSLSFLPATTIPLPDTEKLLSADSPFKVLKDFQFQIYLDANKELKKHLSRFIIHMPTGSGKTRTSMEFITEFINNADGDSAFIWLAHSEELCEQSLQCLKEVWDHVAKKNLKLYRYWGNHNSLPMIINEPSFIIASFQKLYSTLQGNSDLFKNLSKFVKLIIIDEAHKVIAPTYKEVTKALIGNQTKVVGLTATPGRGVQSIEENKELSEFFFNKIITIATPSTESVISLLRTKQILSKVISEPLISAQTYNLDSRQIQYLEKNFDFSPGFLKQLGDDDIRNMEIIKKLDYECKQGCNALFFGCSVEHSKFICSVLLYLGHSAAHIDGSTDKNLRKKYIEDFRNEKISVLCNYGVLSTGFDAPKTNLIFIARPTSSIVLYSQMIGRGIRGIAIGGTGKCKLIDVRDNIIGFSDFDYVYNYFEDYWTENE